MSNSIFDNHGALLKFKSTSGLGMDTSTNSVCGLIIEKKIIYHLRSKSIERYKLEAVIENGSVVKDLKNKIVKENVAYYSLPTLWGEIELEYIQLKIERIDSSDLKSLYNLLLEKGVDMFIKKVFPKIHRQ